MTTNPVVAFLGLGDWYEKGRSGPNCTYSRGPLSEGEVEAHIKVDLRPTLNVENPVRVIWARPNLDLGLPDGNVRCLFEGCIGFEGSTDGHLWDGKLESLASSDSVGLDVYLAVLAAEGAIITRKGN